MKKYLVVILILCSFGGYAQTPSSIDTFVNYKGKFVIDSSFTAPRIAGQYLNSFLGWVSLADSVRPLISYTGANYFAYNQTTGVMAGSPVSLSGTNVTGTLTSNKGGTGFSTYAVGDIIWASATNTLSKLPHGTTSQRLGWNGSALAWIDTAASAGSVTPSALTKTDDTNVTLTLGGTPSTSLLQAVSLTLGWAGTLSKARGGTNSSDYTTATETLSNKRWVARVGSTTSSATPTINTDSYDIYKLTAQAADITSFTTNLTGTPNDGDILEIQITGTAARALTFGASFVSSTVTIPTTTVTTATLTIIFQYFTTSSYGNNKWVCAKYF